MRILFIASALVLAACGSQPDTKQGPVPVDAEFRQLPGQNRFTMIIPANLPADRWKEVAKQKCGPVEFCQVFAWTDPAEASQTFPMTDRELKALAFSYGVNRNTGHEHAVWDCDRFKRENSEECG